MIILEGPTSVGLACRPFRTTLFPSAHGAFPGNDLASSQSTGTSLTEPRVSLTFTFHHRMLIVLSLNSATGLGWHCFFFFSPHGFLSAPHGRPSVVGKHTQQKGSMPVGQVWCKASGLRSLHEKPTAGPLGHLRRDKGNGAWAFYRFSCSLLSHFQDNSSSQTFISHLVKHL